jgi:hypothetical protein
MSRQPFTMLLGGHVANLRPLADTEPYDWQDDEPLTALDLQLICAVLGRSDIKAVREAGRRLEHHHRRTGTSPAGAGRQGVPGSPSRLQRPGVIDPDGGAA